MSSQVARNVAAWRDGREVLLGMAGAGTLEGDSTTGFKGTGRVSIHE